MPRVPIHLHSNDGSSLPLALRLQREGHPVTFHVKAPAARYTGKGLVPFATEPPKGALVVFDGVKNGALGTKYRKAGHLVIGGNPLDEQLECDRPAGARMMRQAGIKTPPTFPFKDVPSAIKFLDKAADAAWFVKVSGDVAEVTTFDAPDADSMIRYLEWIDHQGKVDPFELQQTVTGTEVSCNGWFNGREFVPPYDLTIEEKKFQAGDEGPRTGCESCVVWHATDDALAERTVCLIEDELAAAGYVGPIDLNALTNRETLWGLEWTARLGFDATQAWMRLFDGDLGEQLEAFAAGELDEWEPGSASRSATLRVSIPPYPTWDEKLLAKTRGLPLDDRILTDTMIDPVDVMDGPEAAGASGIVCTVGAVEDSVEALRKRLLDTAQDLVIPNRQMRVDPLDRAERDLNILKDLKLA